MFLATCLWEAQHPGMNFSVFWRNFAVCDDWIMSGKLIYWVPIVGVFVSLVHYDRENGMSAFWCYYQTAILMGFIWIMAFVFYGR